jgi:hypothetical protein
MDSIDSRSNRSESVHDVLCRGVAIPAHPLALDANRQLSERHQRALSRYYLSAGVGGLAVAVHTTQFQIHDPQVGLLKPVLMLAAEEMDRRDLTRAEPLVRVAGICGDTNQATQEALVARDLGYHFGLLNLGALKNKSLGQLISHCRAVADVMDVFGFYLQQLAGGLLLPYTFWREICKIPNIKAIKIAPFNRYQTLDVVRAVVESGREDIALYTGNDDNIINDLLTPYCLKHGNQTVERRIVGGLLGQWSVGTSRAVELLQRCQNIENSRNPKAYPDLLRCSVELTDFNAAVFDAANNFSGCIPGINEVLHRAGLLEGNWCLDENEVLSQGQAEELDRVESSYPHLFDTHFIAENRDAWLN